MAKTTRIPNTFASQGAVSQRGGNLPVYRCNLCGDEVVWVKSKKTGRHYLCNVRRGYHDQRFYMGNDLHPRNCAERKAKAIREIERRELIRQVFDTIKDPMDRIEALESIEKEYGTGEEE